MPCYSHLCSSRIHQNQAAVSHLVLDGASAINCWWDQVKDLINISLQPNLASTILLSSKSLGTNVSGQKELRSGRQTVDCGSTALLGKLPFRAGKEAFLLLGQLLLG